MSKIYEFGDSHLKVKEYCKFASLKEVNNGLSWDEWNIFEHEKLNDLNNYHLFLQMILFEEWNSIKEYALKKGVSIIGDIPFYVGFDSSDVFFNQNLFLLENKKRTFVSGVGPDYFSKEGQMWGNPIYFYQNMYGDGYSFLVDRIIEASKLYDYVRIDHFRAFDTYYVIKAEEKTAMNGEWWKCPGYEILDSLFSKKSDIKLIAEDLGLLTPEVYALRDHYKLPGMNVIEFNIFEDIAQEKDTSNLISYLGTHDNSTIKSFVRNLTIKEKREIRKYFRSKKIYSLSLVNGFIKYLFSKENAIISFVDLLKLSDKYRINKPSTISNLNWSSKLVNFDKLFKNLKKVSK